MQYKNIYQHFYLKSLFIAFNNVENLKFYKNFFSMYYSVLQCNLMYYNLFSA